MDKIIVVPGFISREACSEIIRVTNRVSEMCPVNLNLPGYKTPNVMQQFDINRAGIRNAPVLFDAFSKMKAKWEEYGGVKTTWEDPKLRPQVIHYPRGGGFFGRHSHPLEPQQYGLVLSLTDGPATTFHLDDGDVETEREAGDLTLFRYDIPHSVPMVDPGVPLEFFRPTGR